MLFTRSQRAFESASRKGMVVSWWSGRKKICISFDWHHDRVYRHMLSAWAANPRFTFDFEDLTPGEIDTNSVARVKGVIRGKIRNSTHLLAIIGAHANERHPDSLLIGDLNWQWWEINAAKEEGKKLIAVKLANTNPTPAPLYSSGATWAMSYTQEAILKAINESW